MGPDLASGFELKVADGVGFGNRSRTEGQVDRGPGEPFTRATPSLYHDNVATNSTTAIPRSHAESGGPLAPRWPASPSTARTVMASVAVFGQSGRT